MVARELSSDTSAEPRHAGLSSSSPRRSSSVFWRNRNWRDRAVGTRADAEVRVARRRSRAPRPTACRSWRAPLVAGLGELVRRRRRLGERQADASERRAGPDVARRRAGSGARCASARGCAPTSRRRASRRTSRARASAGSPRLSSTTADQNSTFVASTRSGWRSCELARARLLERLRDLDARRAELLRRPPEHARARVLGAVDAVAEAHQALAAVEQLLDVALGVAAAAATSSSIGSTRAGAPPCSGPGERADGRRERGRAVGAGRGDDARRERRRVQAVLGGADPVRVDRLDVLGSASPRHSSRNRSAAVSPCVDASSARRARGRRRPRADWATIDIIVAESRPRSSRACVVGDVDQLAAAPLAAEARGRRLQVGRRVARSRPRSAYGSAGPGIRARGRRRRGAPRPARTGTCPTSSSMSTPRYRSEPPSRSGSAICVSKATTPSSPGLKSRRSSPGLVPDSRPGAPGTLESPGTAIGHYTGGSGAESATEQGHRRRGGKRRRDVRAGDRARGTTPTSSSSTSSRACRRARRST